MTKVYSSHSGTLVLFQASLPSLHVSRVAITTWLCRPSRSVYLIRYPAGFDSIRLCRGFACASFPYQLPRAHVDCPYTILPCSLGSARKPVVTLIDRNKSATRIFRCFSPTQRASRFKQIRSNAEKREPRFQQPSALIWHRGTDTRTQSTKSSTCLTR